MYCGRERVVSPFLEKENRMKRFALMMVASSMFVCAVASAADGGTDTDTDTDVDAGCTYGEADCSSDPWMWCNAANEWVETGCLPVDEVLDYTPCNCDSADPCGWAGDGYCDEGCLSVVDEMFDDTADCTEFDAGTDTDTDTDSDADTDTDTSTDTDTGDAGTGGGSKGCGCRAAGAPADGSLLSIVL
jgi:hypothetical protein